MFTLFIDEVNSSLYEISLRYISHAWHSPLNPVCYECENLENEQTMTDKEYNLIIESTLSSIEEAVDEYIDDIDPEMNGGILALTFNNGSKIIINKQAPLHQLWLATQHQAYHFDYVNSEWICDRSQKNLHTILNEACSEQAGRRITLKEI